MRVKAVIDRFEGNKTVLLLGDTDDAVVWPRAFLPPEAAEGDLLWLNINVAAEATREARDEAAALLRQLMDGNK